MDTQKEFLSTIKDPYLTVYNFSSLKKTLHNMKRGISCTNFSPYVKINTITENSEKYTKSGCKTISKDISFRKISQTSKHKCIEFK